MTKQIIISAVLFVIGVGVGITIKDALAQSSGGGSSWELQTRIYASSKGTWDAYALDRNTGEVWFINQDVKTLVREGKAKGASGK